MRNYIRLFFLGLLILSACTDEVTIPANVIAPAKMTGILVDLHIADGNLYDITQLPDTLYKHGMGQYLRVFKLHHTDTLAFKKSFKWYTRHPEQLDKVYDDVIAILKAKNDSITKVKPKKNVAPAK